jgi:hypothetical protein
VANARSALSVLSKEGFSSLLDAKSLNAFVRIQPRLAYLGGIGLPSSLSSFWGERKSIATHRFNRIAFARALSVRQRWTSFWHPEQKRISRDAVAERVSHVAGHLNAKTQLTTFTTISP